MSASNPETVEPASPGPRPRLSIDWWAVILAGVFVALAATGLLPTIGW